MRRRAYPNQNRFFLTLALLVIPCMGCRDPISEPILSVKSVAIDHYTDAGVQWRKQGSLEPADQAILARFFQTQSAWRDSTELEGEPVVYAAGDQRRYYWIRPAQADAIWTCIHWEKKRFRTSSGTGPLLATAN